MKTHWKTFAVLNIMTAVIMTAVLVWDFKALNADVLDWAYISVKSITIITFYSFGFYGLKSRSVSAFREDAYLIIFYLYSLYGMACIDMTYNFSFVEAVVIGAFLIRQTGLRFTITTSIGFICMLIGYYLAKEPDFVAPGESYKHHSLTISTILFVFACFVHFLFQQYQRKVNELNEKFALIGKQSSFLMHEIKNPLNRVVANAGNDFSAEVMSDILKDSQKISALVTSIETLIHHPEKLTSTFTNFDLSETRATLIQEYGNYLESMNIEFDCRELEGSFYGNKYLVYQMLKNFVVNAVEAIGYKKDVRSLLKISLEKLNKKIFIRVKNTNSQIPTKNIDQIFDPHFTTKKNGSNKGLGLSLVKSIVEAHYGKISVTSKDNVTIFEVVMQDYTYETA